MPLQTLPAGDLDPEVRAIGHIANFSSIATDAKGAIQTFNVGAARMRGYAAVDVLNKITPAGISDPREPTARAGVLSAEIGTSRQTGRVLPAVLDLAAMVAEDQQACARLNGRTV